MCVCTCAHGCVPSGSSVNSGRYLRHYYAPNRDTSHSPGVPQSPHLSHWGDNSASLQGVMRAQWVLGTECIEQSLPEVGCNHTCHSYMSMCQSTQAWEGRVGLCKELGPRCVRFEWDTVGTRAGQSTQCVSHECLWGPGCVYMKCMCAPCTYVVICNYVGGCAHVCQSRAPGFPGEQLTTAVVRVSGNPLLQSHRLHPPWQGRHQGHPVSAPEAGPCTHAGQLMGSLGPWHRGVPCTVGPAG